MVLAMPALTLVAQNTQNPSAQSLSTQTSLTAETRDQAGRMQATIAVTGEDGLPATGAVVVSDRGTQLAGAALNAQGHANIMLSLTAGDHSLTAAYAGDATHQASVSQSAQVQTQVSPTPSFQVSVSPATLTLTAGQTGTVTASVTPSSSFTSTLSAPLFVTLSCSALPDQSACTFTPENLEILPNTTTPLTSSMVLVTQAQSSTSAVLPHSGSIALALLLPGALGLGGLAWAARRRRWLNRLSLLALLGLITMLGTTACNPRYNYEHHGPPLNPATPSGTYTIMVTAQSSNGVDAITNSTSLALTVQ
jgi:hypothetical protein